MTRSQQNEHILNKILAQLGDIPNVQDILENRFSQWFRDLVAAGTAAMSAANAAPSEEAI